MSGSNLAVASNDQKERFEVKKAFYIMQGYSEELATKKASSALVGGKGCFSNSKPDQKSETKPNISYSSNSTSLNMIIRKIDRYCIIKLSLYALIVPLTANTIQAALSKAGFTDWFLVVVSWLLALTTDYVALDHFSKSQRPFESNEDLANSAIAAFILIANLLGAFLLFEKEMKIEVADIASDKIAQLEEKLESLKVLSSNAYSTYVTKKRPKAADPVACEIGTGTNCGPVYITSSPQAAAANAAKSQYISLELQIKKVESQLNTQLRAMPTDQNRSDFWWHLGYYAFIWFLLLSVIRLEKISRRRSNAVAA